MGPKWAPLCTSQWSSGITPPIAVWEDPGSNLTVGSCVITTVIVICSLINIISVIIIINITLMKPAR